LKNYTKPVTVVGPSDSQKAHICHAVSLHNHKKSIFIAFNEMQARKLFEDFSFFLGNDVLFFPSREIMLYDVEAKSYDTAYQRIRVMDRMLRGDYSIVVTSAEAVSHKLVSPDMFRGCILEITMKSRLDLPDLARRLVMMAYEKTEIVERAGQFAIRGGIIDIFSIDSEHAVRIELFDDEVDSIRQFDINTQRSVGRMEEARIIPAREVIYPAGRMQEIISDIRSDLSKHSKKIPGLSQKINEDMERMKEDHYFPGIDRYIPYIIDVPHFLTDYAGDPYVFIDEPVRQKQRVENILLEHYEICRGLLEKARILPRSQEIYFDYESQVSGFEKQQTISLNTINADNRAVGNNMVFSIPCKQIGSFQGHIDLLCESISEWKSQKRRIIVLSGTRGRGERLVETLISKEIETFYTDNIAVPVSQGQVVITHGSLHKGFEYPSIGFVIVSDKEVFGQDRKPGKVTSSHKGSKINIFTELNVGDYVVHEAHGIGQYVSIEKLAVEGVKRDYLKIRYQESGFLYIPTNQMDLIQKYVGSEGKSPRLSKLGGADWLKTKNRVRESLKELAGELIKLYAQRQSARGFAFSPDTVWQKQFEEQFPYEETDDQLKCIDEIKNDMESGRLMDRLLCGDVGYGKTEVAIRAIFKAVIDGKQVAYLVPTTVLAQQQYVNFVERMKDFPVVVDMLSRFRTQSEQKKILRDVKAGNIDVLIGTHRLLQKDINFKDLGLLVIDEEQRFGVTHKEKLKNMKPDVSVLTLTATPIPRTLHMSLAGIRDISIIGDPPEERYPVQTYVMEYDRDVVQDAMMRELSRKGQVFYLYNRVRTIDLKASEIQSFIPDARVAVAHGQMEERMLEDIMFSFLKGEYDILVCTTIIESGLDMPNVNTIVVEDADRMGLAQLYQLRGRVGRSNRLAYAYITYKKDKVVAEIAEKRLQAIKEFTELGSGFKIAMRDMEIRGAGNLLGPEQHGHMESVGYDMYCRLLDEAIRELKGEPLHKANADVAIDINISAFIDDNYIGIEARKIEMYKKIAAIQDQQDVLDIVDELTDRYGDIPGPVRNLINIAHIKAIAGSLGFTAVQEKNDAIIFPIRSMKSINMEAIGKTAAIYKRQLLFNAGASPYLMYRISGINRNQLLDNIKIVLQDLKSFDVN
ncbi:MAG: transcription-repair coupling factor, partial [Ruminiclostridium sp.]|nr:transcription-repair coupling factor [Ruminiclostridium sp.]